MQGCLSLPPPFNEFVASPFRFLWHAGERTVVLSDLHLGAEAGLARQGLYLPDTSSGAIARRWQHVVDVAPARVILAGDIFDAREPDVGAVALLGELVSRLPGDAIVTMIPGNHDPEGQALAELCPDARVRVEAAARVGRVTVFHGHQAHDARGVGEGRWGGPADDPQRYWAPAALITGHQHPAVILQTRVRSAKMICFVSCEVRGGGYRVPLVILPAFSPLPLGSNLLTERNWILDLPRPADAEVRVLGIIEKPGAEQVLDFGPLSGLMA